MLLVVLGLVVVLAGAILYGKVGWNSGTRELRDRLEAARLPIEPKVFDRRELEHLPAPVQRYFRAVLEDGQSIVAAVAVEHTGDAVDDQSARATLNDGDLTITLLFSFTEDGLIDTVSADARPRVVGGTVAPAPWQGRFWNYAVRDGMRVPLDGEVAWLLPEGVKPYWRGHITKLSYEFAR